MHYVPPTLRKHNVSHCKYDVCTGGEEERSEMEKTKWCKGSNNGMIMA